MNRSCHWCNQDLSNGLFYIYNINCKWCQKEEISCKSCKLEGVKKCTIQEEHLQELNNLMKTAIICKKDYEKDLRERNPTESELCIIHFMEATIKMISMSNQENIELNKFDINDIKDI